MRGILIWSLLCVSHLLIHCWRVQYSAAALLLLINHLHNWAQLSLAPQVLSKKSLFHPAEQVLDWPSRLCWS